MNYSGFAKARAVVTHAFGSSYDFPIGLEGVTQLPNLTRGFLSRAHDEQTIKSILGENLLEFFERV